ncbi:MAG: hypothetical protein MH213_15195 [Marinobacter sp.]|nr:hypothetical protein [Marinobacter sp.]
MDTLGVTFDQGFGKKNRPASDYFFNIDPIEGSDHGFTTLMVSAAATTLPLLIYGVAPLIRSR